MLSLDGTLIVQLVNFIVFLVILNEIFMEPVGAAANVTLLDTMRTRSTRRVLAAREAKAPTKQLAAPRSAASPESGPW